MSLTPANLRNYLQDELLVSSTPAERRVSLHGARGPASGIATMRMLLSAIAVAILLGALGCGSADGDGGQSSGASNELDSEGMSAAVEAMIKTADSRDRVREMVRLADGLTPENLPGALEAYERDLARIDSHEIRIFTNAWAKLTPKRALDRIRSKWRYPQISFQAVEEVVYVWARSDDAAAAREYVDPSIESDERNRASTNKFMILAVLKALVAAGEPEELTKLLGSFEAGGDRELWLTEVMIEMNRVGKTFSTRKWVDSIPWDAANGLKLSALSRAMDWTAKVDPKSAAGWYENIESDPRTLGVLGSVVSSWGVYEPAEALLWLADRKASLERDKQLRFVAFGWLSRKHNAAEAWMLDHVSNEVILDRTMVLVVNERLKKGYFQEAYELAPQIPNQLEREGALAGVFVMWIQNDPTTARDEMKKANVSKAVREIIARRLRSGVTLSREAKKLENKPMGAGNDQ